MLIKLFILLLIFQNILAGKMRFGGDHFDNQGISGSDERSFKSRVRPSRFQSNMEDDAIIFLDNSDKTNSKKNSNNNWNNKNTHGGNYNSNSNLFTVDLNGTSSSIWNTDERGNQKSPGNSNSFGSESDKELENSNSDQSDHNKKQVQIVWSSEISNIKEIGNSNQKMTINNGPQLMNLMEFGDNKNNNNKKKISNGNSSNRKLLPEDICGIDLPNRILGGTTAEIDEFPWLALLQYRNRSGKISHDCSGALISSRYVITAAHCTIGLDVTTRKLTLEKVRLGEWDLSTEKDCQQERCSESVQDIEIEAIINHRDYKPRKKSQSSDIALIRLGREAEINQFVQPLCLPLDQVGSVNFEGRKLSVSGWGRTANVKNSNSDVKMKVEVPVVTWDQCRSFYESFYSVKIDETQMCAGGEEGQDTCQGDSGGPLMGIEKIGHEFRWFVIGIVSSGPAACGVEGRPSLYTKVSEFTSWILENMKP